MGVTGLTLVKIRDYSDFLWLFITGRLNAVVMSVYCTFPFLFSEKLANRDFGIFRVVRRLGLFTVCKFEFEFGHVAARDGMRRWEVRGLYTVSSVVTQWKLDWLALEKCMGG
jgi:hypothetical protein